MLHGKKYRAAKEKLPGAAVELPIDQALEKVKESAYAKFDETVDVHINLGIDPAKGEQAVRGSLVLPHGLGKAPRIVVFAKGDAAEQAKKAGVEFVGTDDLVEKINAGWMEFDFAVATPDLMGLVGKLAKLLGPRGLLPNKKNGTVTFDVGPVINDLKKGRLFFKNDKSGLVHFSFGKASFDKQRLQDNLTAFLQALTAVKPGSVKGKFIKKITVCSTMGPGVRINADAALNLQ
jgi:large subunit ribosomal protein L1